MADDTIESLETKSISPNLINPTETFDSSHAAFVDQFGTLLTVISCGIAGYQIL